MALTKITRSLLNTGVSDSSDATAITIDSSENVTFSGTILTSGDTNGEVSHRLQNVNAGNATESSLYISNAASNAAGLALGTTGTGFTTTGGYVQDGSHVVAGTGVSGGLSIMTRAAADIRFYTNGHTNERMRITSDGRLGLGTTSPSQPFNIGTSNSGTYMLLDDGTNCLFQIQSTTSAGIIQVQQTGFASWKPMELRANYFELKPNNTTALTLSGTTADFTHAATAHTNGLNIINSQAGGYGSALKFQSERSDNNAIVTAARIRTEGAEAWNADSAVSSAFIFESIENNSLQEIMRFTSNGRCLIGTSSAIGSGSNGHGLDVFSVGGGPHVMNLKNSDTSGGANMIRFIDGSGDVCGEINSNATNNTTSYGTSSDGRYKDVIGEARGLEIINSLNPVKFTWKSSGEEDEGLIAQEVLKIVPNAVTGSEETKYMMDYSKLVTPLIAAIQEQQKEIEELKRNSHPPKTIEEMEGYEDLINRIKELENK